ncbi:STAS domain-containing protein [Elizabethkingia argentiflava]|uniref:STAS domain-containing protein n=1 Tax=Elizabethkingia argenteiflava TaxID=2681556 RepID=A0A845Q029_9FLAO|nr:SulP family inorganic anion transporter [Elizabethkingia argenteiflava]NAW51680.1 STAS domain-containing protein [Elizabethkingia argenteiflava]
MTKLISRLPWTNLNILKETLAGLTVAMTMIPESISFALLAGLSPLTGLYAAFIMGLVTGILGGRPGMVSGGAGATVVVLISLVSVHGTQYLFAAVLLAGILQILVGVFKLGKYVRLIPQPVMYGFLNGLAVIIFMAQVEQFKITQNGTEEWIKGAALYMMLGLAILTMTIVLIFPRLTKTIPSSLVAIMLVSGIVYFLHIDTPKVGDIASVTGVLPSFAIPRVPFTLETLGVIFPYALIMAGVGLIESLLTLNMVDEMTHTKGKSDKESIAQGVANISNGFFGGMGGCAMVGQTLVNIGAGARTKISSIIGALSILFIILVGGPVIEQIPRVALVGVMIVVAFNTFQWTSFQIVNKMPISDIFVGILVAVITILLHNLALAVIIGVAISAIVFAWDNAKRISARILLDEKGHKIYEISGLLFFASSITFNELFDIHNDPQKIIIDFKGSRVMDMSAIGALKKVVHQYENQNKEVVLRHLSRDCRKLLDKAEGFLQVKIQEDVAKT